MSGAGSRLLAGLAERALFPAIFRRSASSRQVVTFRATHNLALRAVRAEAGGNWRVRDNPDSPGVVGVMMVWCG